MYELRKSTIYFPDRAPVQVSVEVHVKATPKQVWDVLMDNPGWVNWYQGMTKCEDVDDSKKGKLGATRRVCVNGLVASEEFIALEPEKLWVFTVCESSAPLCRRWVERIILEEAPKGEVGTRILYKCGIEPLWLGKLLRPIIVRSTYDCWKKSLEQIDAYLAKKNSTSM